MRRGNTPFDRWLLYCEDDRTIGSMLSTLVPCTFYFALSEQREIVGSIILNHEDTKLFNEKLEGCAVCVAKQLSKTRVVIYYLHKEVVRLEKIGTIIRNHRIAQGLTQEELGEKVFVSKQIVSKWETGKTLPDIEKLRKLCDILEISKDEVLGGSIEETKNSRIWLKVVTIISVVSILVALFFGLSGFGYVDSHTQSGVAYVSLFWDGELLTTDEYRMTSDLHFEDFKNGYKFEIDYGKIRGTINLFDKYDIAFGFVNTNNWHNVHIRLDVEKKNDQLVVRQTVTYETDNKVYQVIETENTTTDNEVSVYREGV